MGQLYLSDRTLQLDGQLTRKLAAVAARFDACQEGLDWGNANNWDRITPENFPPEWASWMLTRLGSRMPKEVRKLFLDIVLTSPFECSQVWQECDLDDDEEQALWERASSVYPRLAKSARVVRRREASARA